MSDEKKCVISWFLEGVMFIKTWKILSVRIDRGRYINEKADTFYLQNINIELNFLVINRYLFDYILDIKGSPNSKQIYLRRKESSWEKVAQIFFRFDFQDTLWNKLLYAHSYDLRRNFLQSYSHFQSCSHDTHIVSYWFVGLLSC